MRPLDRENSAAEASAADRELAMSVHETHGGTMLRFRSPITACIALAIVLISCAGAPAASQPTSTLQPTPTLPATSTSQPTSIQPHTGLQHIFYIMMENHAENQIIGNT